MAGNDFDKQLGILLGKLREEKGWSQEQLRAEVDVKRRETITQWENGTREIKAKRLKELCKAFDVSADYLLGISGDKRLKHIAVDELGLSQGAVDQIKEVKRRADNDPYFYRTLAALNSMLGGEQLQTLLGYIANAEIAAEKSRAAKEQSDAVKRTHRLLENSDYLNYKDTYSYKKYVCVKLFEKMLDTFCKAEDLDE